MSTRPTKISTSGLSHSDGSVEREVNRVAKTLARLSKTTRSASKGLYQAEDRQVSEAAVLREVLTAIAARRLRAQFFEQVSFEDPAWDILLNLFAAEMAQAEFSISELRKVAGVPPTTALRWITNMIKAGLIEREQDQEDGRRRSVKLSRNSLEAMQNYIFALTEAGLFLV